MSNTDLSEYIPKFVLSNYDMNVDVRIKNAPNKTFIYTWIIFTPKKINSLTPNETNFFAKYDWIHPKNGKEELSYDDASLNAMLFTTDLLLHGREQRLQYVPSVLIYIHTYMCTYMH